MTIYPAIDIVGGKAVRLLHGDYEKMTVYGEHPENVALDFVSSGASHIHIVDLEGARDGGTPNFDTVSEIKRASGVFCEVGGGIRSEIAIEKYLSAGIDRVILGTSAVKNFAFLRRAVELYGSRVAVGVDIKDGFVAVSGWKETTRETAFDFCRKMEDAGVSTLIVTDISKDGAMKGTNLPLYKELKRRFSLDITASGGVSTLDDIRALASIGLYGAIIGKAYYTGAIKISDAIKAAKALR